MAYNKSYLIVHSVDGDDDTNTAVVDQRHRQIGYLGCGHHYVITRAGEAQAETEGYPARPLWQPAAFRIRHAYWNRVSISVAIVGQGDYTEEQIASLVNVIDLHTNDPWDIHPANVMGYRDLLLLTTNKEPKTTSPDLDVRGLMQKRIAA